MAVRSSYRSLLGAAAVAALGLSATPVFAHHSFGAFDRTKEMTVTGTVKVWRWANPHPMMTIVADKDGAVADYVFEWPAPVQLQEKGWTRNLAKIGDKVVIKYNPWKSGSPGGLFQDITSPEGKSLKARQ